MTKLILPLLLSMVSLTVSPPPPPPPPPSFEKNLYERNETGILSLETEELTRTVVGSSKSWLVQFYSSWCGHCKRFRRTFTSFGVQVEGWSDAVGIAVINCASDANTQTCRDHDVDGYPSIKFFPPNATSGDVGRPSDKELRTVPQLLTATANWIEGMQRDGLYASAVVPPLVGLRSGDPADIWTSAAATADHEALVVFSCRIFDFNVAEIVLDLHADADAAAADDFVVRKVDVEDVERRLVSNLNLDRRKSPSSSSPPPLLVAVDRSNVNAVEVLLYETEENAEKSALKSAIYERLSQTHPSLRLVHSAPAPEPVAVTSTSPPSAVAAVDVVRRRYTVHLADVELALDYALTHEVGQRRVVSGDALVALKDFTRILVKYFPSGGSQFGRPLLRQLDVWVADHDDALLGVRLAAKVRELKSGFGVDVVKKSYVGCKGSRPEFGGYPCGLWTLWHCLTVNHKAAAAAADDGSDGAEVLLVMAKYVDLFFGCRDCADNFARMTGGRNGTAISRRVRTAGDSVMWLWEMHNEVNERLSGDDTDDPVYPKRAWPDRQRCPYCYADGQRRFNLDRVETFLQELYTVGHPEDDDGGSDGDDDFSPVWLLASVALSAVAAIGCRRNLTKGLRRLMRTRDRLTVSSSKMI